MYLSEFKKTKDKKTLVHNELVKPSNSNIPTFTFLIEMMMAVAESDSKFHDVMNQNPLVKGEPNFKAHSFAVEFVRKELNREKIIYWKYPTEILAYFTILEWWKNR